MYIQTITFNLKEARQSRIHVDGAIALLESRGLEQFTHERGAHLLGQVYTRMVCFHQPEPIPSNRKAQSSTFEINLIVLSSQSASKKASQSHQA